MSRFFVMRTLKDWKAGDLPMQAAVAVGIADHVETGGKLVISDLLMTETEVDFVVDGLIAELERFRRDAKRTICADNAKVKADVSARLSDRLDES